MEIELVGSDGQAAKRKLRYLASLTSRSIFGNKRCVKLSIRRGIKAVVDQSRVTEADVEAGLKLSLPGCDE